VLALVAFIPTVVVTRSLFAVLNVIPAIYFVRSILPMIRGDWHKRPALEQACSAGFIGLLLTPVTLTLTFLLNGLFSF